MEGYNLIKQYQDSALKNIFEKLLLACVFIYAFSITLHPDISKWLINQMFYLWIFSLRFTKVVNILKDSRLTQVLLLFFVILLLSCFYNSEMQNFYNLNLMFKYFILPVMILVTSIEKKYINYILYSFLSGMFFSQLAIYSYHFGLVEHKFIFELFSFKDRFVPFMLSHMEYSLFLSIAILISFYLAISEKKKYVKFVFAGLALSLLVNLFLSTGRTGQFTLLITSIVLTLYYFRSNFKYMIASFLLIASIFILAFINSNTFQQRVSQGYSDVNKVVQKQHFNSNLGVRLSSYYLLPSFVLNENFNFLLGMGYCNVDERVHKIQIEHFGLNTIFKHQQGHLLNSYITIFVGAGILGIILLIAIWYFIFTTKMYDKSIRFYQLSFALVVLLGGFTENMFRQKEVMLLAALFISIIIVSQMKHINNHGQDNE